MIALVTAASAVHVNAPKEDKSRKRKSQESNQKFSDVLPELS